jgi:hypothetical protein
MEQAFKNWEDMPVLEQYAYQYWDMYKDAYGIRPRGIDTSTWIESDFIREFEHMAQVIELEAELQKIRQDEAIAQFTQRLSELLRMGAHDVEMALRWIHEAEGTNGDDQFLSFELGLPYNYFTTSKE